MDCLNSSTEKSEIMQSSKTKVGVNCCPLIARISDISFWFSKTSLISSDIFWLLKNARASLHHGHCDFIYKIGLLIYIFVY